MLNTGRFYSRFVLSFKYGFKLGKPKLISRTFRNYLKLIAGHSPLLRSVDFAPTYKCNMQCEHCFAAYMEDTKRSPLSVDEYSTICQEAASLGAIHIAFQGGEPLLEKRLTEIIKASNPSNFLISITTNGSLITENKILELKNNGVDMLTISIDSGIPDEHDKFRKFTGAYARAINAVNLCFKHDLGICINTMITHKNIRSAGLMKIIKFCKKKKIKLTVILPAMTGKWENSFNLMLNKTDYHILNSLMKKFSFIRRDLDSNYLKWGCGAVKEMIYINPYGDVMPCSFIHCKIGNLRENSLEYIRRRGLVINEFKNYAQSCLAAEDMNFIKQRMSNMTNNKKRPVEFHEMFPDAGYSS